MRSKRTDIFENLISIREWSNEDLEQSKSSGEATIGSTQTICQLVMASSIPSESITFKTDSFLIEASKISYDIDYNEYCGANIVTVSDEYVYAVSLNATVNMDCVLMITDYNLYLLSPDSIYQYNNYTSYSDPFQTNFVLLDIKRENSYNTTINTDIIVSKSDPIIISFEVSNLSFFDTISILGDNDVLNHFPLCSFYNESLRTFDNTNCFLLSYNSTRVDCFVLHLTYFGVSWDEFAPEINFLTTSEWKSATFENVLNYPLGFIIVLSWCSVCILLMSLFHLQSSKIINIPYFNSLTNIRNRPLIAESQAYMEKVLADDQLKSKYRSIRVIQLFKNDNFKSLSRWQKFWEMYKISLRNDHLWFGLCKRDYGTNYSFNQRIAIMMVRFLTTLRFKNR